MDFSGETAQRLLKEVGFWRLVGFWLLQRTRLIRVLTKPMRARLVSPILNVVVAEQPDQFMSALQEVAEATLSEKELDKPVNEQVEQLVTLYPMLQPWESYLRSFIINMQAKARE